MKKHFPIIIEQDQDGIFIVNCPILKGCRSYGETLDIALNNISEAIKVCIDEAEPDDTDTTMFIGIRDLEIAVSTP